MIEERIAKIQAKLKGNQAFLALTYENPLSTVDTLYLSGYQASFAAILISPDFTYYITHDLYFNEVKTKLKGKFSQIINLDQKLSEVLVSLIKKHKIEGLKFSDNISLREYQIVKALKLNKQKTDWLNQMRVIKSPEEIKLIDESCKIALEALEQTKNIIEPGRTENEIAAYLEWQMRKLGAEGIAFNTVAAGGTNGATPHAKPTDRKLRNGEFITLDFGCRYQGHCSDITRTVAIGKPDGKLAEIYNVVQRAQQAGINSLKLKDVKTVGDVDRVTRQVIEDAGYGDYFTHSTGHGISLEAHEFPHVSPGQTTKLKAGMVFTIEPGIYIPGLGGVRIEDCVVVEEGGGLRVLGSN
jgi:Xaa-Pro aminopeptidase